MNAIYLLVGGIVVYLLGYLIYARYLAKKIFKLDPDAPVPSKTRPRTYPGRTATRPRTRTPAMSSPRASPLVR